MNKKLKAFEYQSRQADEIVQNSELFKIVTRVIIQLLTAFEKVQHYYSHTNASSQFFG